MKRNRLSYLVALAATLVSGHAFGENTNSCGGPGFREDLQQGIVLTATANVPTGASGKAQLIAVNDNGTNQAVLFVKTKGLTNGSYTVTMTDSSSASYSLGSLNVTNPTNGFGFGHNDRRGPGRGSGGGPPEGWTNLIGHFAGTNFALTNLLCGPDATNRFGANVFHWFTNTLAIGEGSFVLPSDLAISNVSGISIADSDGVIDLTGDFTGATNSTSVYIETVGIVPGTATNVQGSATLTVTTKNGKTFGAFKLSATGLDAKQKLYLTANGTNTFKVYTSSSGALKVNSLPRFKIVDLQTVVATDASSNVVFSVSF